MVDAVLYFEGDRGHQFRILRAVKNRFGPTDEIGVFEMSDGGLAEVTNPSRLFMGSNERPTPGTAVFAGMEGTRPLLIEVQALVSPSPLGTPRRTTVGWDSNRLAMILAVLEARAGVQIGPNDVYLNVAGGLKVSEPAADLAVAAALLSSLTGTVIPPGTAVFGEIALSGAIRPVGQTEARLKEAQKLGLKEAVIAAQAEPPGDQGPEGQGRGDDHGPRGVVCRAGSWTTENCLVGCRKPFYKVPSTGWRTLQDYRMPLTLLDFILIGIMLLSGLLALMRGFTREVLSLVAWGAAAVAAYFAIKQPVLVDFAQTNVPYLDKEILAQIARRGRGLPDRADHRLDHQREDFGLRGRFRPPAPSTARWASSSAWSGVSSSWPSPICSTAGCCPSTSRSRG